jgi:hypothetical protein
MPANGFGVEERKVFRRLRTPAAIQQFLDEEVKYNHGPTTFRSPRRVLRDRVAHCLEGAMFAAAALEQLGYPPLVVDLAAVRDDDHVIAVFQENGCWGAIGKSNYAGLRYRTPVYRTVRELVMSYFEHYYNPKGEKTLRAYSKPVSLRRFDSLDWRVTESDLWEVAGYLVEIPHFPVLPGELGQKRLRMDRRLYEAGLVGAE